MIQIDGSYGEGGGQILRSALTLSLLSGLPLRVINIRAGRSKPGLRPQHLAAVRAAAAISAAQVEGAEIGSMGLKFQPGPVSAGKYYFDVGTAGATTLVLQTIFLPLSFAPNRSVVTITGGTHVPWSPCFHYLDEHWLPFMRQMGFEATLTLERPGFNPQGGGVLRAQIEPVTEISPLSINQRGKLKQIRGLSAVVGLPREIAKRQRLRVVARLGSKFPLNDIRIAEIKAPTKGTFIALMAEFERGQACYCALGAPGKRAEAVADEVAEAIESFMQIDGAVDRYLADQLLLPMALARGKSMLRTERVTQHLLTNAWVIEQFSAARIVIQGKLGEAGLVKVYPPGVSDSAF
ncbi:MAG: RNA 3'-terminal phosphate cyclase [Anaerolineae bacterium]|nr:RNA 3'-terminal phosphate cyclase [Anaerolineae bacterium]MBL6965395.1 RNA 3'-terminal phosphate cyclase [Anaerolineales bacterium]